MIHCGACMTNFDSMDALNEHLNDCPAASYMLPLLYQVWGGNDKSGHPLSHFIQNLHKNADTIKYYAYAIADEMDSFHRSKIHAKLCIKLELDYNKFRPFEASSIKKIPTRKEAENILWEALFSYVSNALIVKE